jgi:hypothetical protein
MSISGNILTQDLARMIDSGVSGQPLSHTEKTRDATLAVASRMTPDQYSDAKFKLAHHGMSPEEWRALQNARKAEEQREQAEAKIRAPYLAAIPSHIEAAKDLYGPRAELSRFNAWLQNTQEDMKELLAARGRLLTMIDAPSIVGKNLGDKINRMVDCLLSSAGIDRGDNVSEAVALEQKRIELEQTAEAARQALPAFESRIATKKMEIETLQGRRDEFVDPCLLEILEESGLMDRREKLRAELSALDKLAGDFAGDHGAYGSQEHQGQWKAFADALAKDPRAKCLVKLP